MIQQPASPPKTVTANALLAELQARGLHVVVGTGQSVACGGLTLAELLAGQCTAAAGIATASGERGGNGQGSVVDSLTHVILTQTPHS